MAQRLFAVGTAAAAIVLWTTPAAAQAIPCTSAQLAVARPQLTLAGAALDAALRAIDHPTSDDLDRLAAWLGVRSTADAAQARQVLASSRAFIGGATFECDVRTDATLGDVYAHVDPNNSFVIALGAFFFTAPETGFSSKRGTIVHEMTHFTLAGATVDPDIYGPDEARLLAQNDPAAARRNAENYEYFVEATVFRLKTPVAVRKEVARRKR